MGDYREVLSRSDIQAVVVATPPYTHFAIVRGALAAGKHVFCENVLVVKPEEIHALRELADRYGNRILQVGLQRRYSKFYQIARQIAAKGFLGEVTKAQPGSSLGAAYGVERRLMIVFRHSTPR